MAEQDTIIEIGSSNMAGFLANLYEVDDGSYGRWFSQVTPAPSTQTFTAATTDIITAVGHGLPDGMRITVASDTTLPGGLTAATSYYLRDVATDTFKVSATLGGAAVDITSAGTGIHTLTRHLAEPYTVQMEGARMWTPRRPYATNHQRLVDTLDAADTITYAGTAISPAPVVGQHAFILSGAGRSAENVLNIIGVVSQQLQFGTALTPAPVAGDTIVVLPSSHTIDSIDATSTIVTRTATTTAFDANDVGRYVLFLVPVVASINSTRRITAFTTTTITLDRPLAGTLPPNGTGFVILDGANAVEDLASMQPPNAVLQDLTVHIDEVTPVYLTGLEYLNYDFTPFQSPRNNDIPAESINSAPELTWNVRAKTARPLVALQLGVSASRIAPFKLQPDSASDNLVGPLHYFTSLDFHPSSPNGIYPILTAAITSMRSLIEAEGNTMKVIGIFINLFDNDPNASYQHLYRIKENTELLRDTLRTFLGDSNIPWIMSGPFAYAGGPGHPNNEFVYDELHEIAAEDPQSGVVDTRVGYTTAWDNFHLDGLSQVKLGQDYYSVWEPIYDRLTDASTAIDVSLCNRALVVIGEAPNVTSLDPPEGSAHAQLCATLFPDAVRTVADSRHWTFADTRVTLQKVRLKLPIMVVTATQRLITTATQHGLKVGSPVTFELAQDGTGTVPGPLVASRVYYVALGSVGPYQFAVTDKPGGTGTAIFFTGAGTGRWRCFKESDRDGSSFMYAVPKDCKTERNVVPPGAPDDWPGMDGSLVGTPYAGTGVVATSRDGLNYSSDSGGFGSNRLLPFKRALSRGGDPVIYTNLGPADLVYSRALDDMSQWPPLFRDAVVYQIASGLAGAIKREPKLVDWCIGKAQGYISEAARVDGHRVVERERQRYPWAR